MPNFNNKGPGGLGPKTGNKLGKCKKTETEKKKIEEIYLFKKGTLKSINTINKVKNK